MRLWPDSLYGRLLLAMCVPIAVVLIASYLLYLADRRALMRQVGGASETVRQVVNLTREWWPLDAGARAAAVAAYNLSVGSGGTRGPPPGATPLHGTGAGGATARELQQIYLLPLRSQLGGQCAATVVPDPGQRAGVADLATPPRFGGPPMFPALDAAAAPPPPPPNAAPPQRPPPHRPGQEHAGSSALYGLRVQCGTAAPLLFRVPLPPGLPDFDATLFWRLLTLAALLGAVLWLVTRRLTRPLRDLQAVASALGRSQPPPRIPESGAREIREALRAFNLMQERLQRYLDSRTRVLAAMSHDLRTPLTRLRLRAETAEHQELRERLIADIEEMDALVQRSLALFRGLNDTEEFQATDLNLWLAEIVTEYRELGREFTVSGRANTPLSIRPQALRRALRNLIDNALNYAGATQVELCDNGATVDVAVLDRGPGIPPEQLAAVREPFHRVEISRSRATGGVGLGLAIATEIAAAHGGALLLRNRADGGLEAILSLPRGA